MGGDTTVGYCLGSADHQLALPTAQQCFSAQVVTARSAAAARCTTSCNQKVHLLFCCPNVHTLHCRLVGLPDAQHFDDLLGSKHSTAKKGAMKTTASSSRAGSIMRVTAVHLGDGKPLTLDLQVCVRAHLQLSTTPPFTHIGNAEGL